MCAPCPLSKVITKALEMQNLAFSKCSVQNGSFVRPPVVNFKCHTFFLWRSPSGASGCFFRGRRKVLPKNSVKIGKVVLRTSFCFMFEVRYMFGEVRLKNLRIGGATMLSL